MSNMTGELVRVYGKRWQIRRGEGGTWTAERQRGTEIRFLVAETAVRLAVKIERAEREDAT